MPSQYNLFATRLLVTLSAITAVLFAGLIWGSSPAAARDVSLTADVVRVEKADDEQIITFLTFTAVTEDYTLQGASGRYLRDSDLFEATGTGEQRVIVDKAGDDPFQVTATDQLAIDLEEETLRAEGDVSYSAEDTHATSRLLIVDRRDMIQAIVQPLLETLPPGAVRELILEFFSRSSADDRLVFLQGDVHIEQSDSTLQAAWVVFNESQTDNMVSVAADGRPIELHFSTVDDEDDRDGDE